MCLLASQHPRNSRCRFFQEICRQRRVADQLFRVVDCSLADFFCRIEHGRFNRSSEGIYGANSKPASDRNSPAMVSVRCSQLRTGV